jgi:shikimate kinase
MNCFLIGMMGSGKSTVGKVLAKKLGWAFRDADQEIEKEAGTSIKTIFEKQGEPVFREMEKRTIARLASLDRAIIAAGGGAPCFEENWASFQRSGKTVYLKVSPGTVLKRLSAAPEDQRPLLKKDSLSEEKIRSILEKREALYQKADWAVDVNSVDPEAAADQISDFIRTQEVKP